MLYRYFKIPSAQSFGHFFDKRFKHEQVNKKYNRTKGKFKLINSKHAKVIEFKID